jgi:hypothetical protein
VARRHRPVSPRTSTLPIVCLPVSSQVYRSPSHPPLSPLLPVQKRRRRRPELSLDEYADPIIGHVTSSGKFKCFDANCSDITFGRQADFRRHYDHTHISKKVEYFCTVDGCTRSRKPEGKSKGRSFGAREDKMREHVRTVHRSGKRKRDGGDEESTDQEELRC